MHTTRLLPTSKSTLGKIFEKLSGLFFEIRVSKLKLSFGRDQNVLFNYAQSEIVMVPGRYPESTLDIDWEQFAQRFLKKIIFFI